MTFGAFLSDRLGALVLRAACAAAAAAFLLATGTSPGVLTIVLIAWLFVAAGALAADYFRCRGHLEELEAIMGCAICRKL